MEQPDFEKYIEERYKKEIDWYDKKSKHNQRVYKRLQVISIVLTSLSPVLVLLTYLLSDLWVAIITVIISIIITIVTSFNRTFKYYDIWINYRTICETLKKEIYLYEAKIDEYEKAEDAKSLFVRRVESLISRENTLWISSYKSEEKVNSKTAP